MSHLKKSQLGFTLVEVIAAIGIFAVLGMGCYKVVNGMAMSRDSIEKHSDTLRELSRAIRMIDADMQQIVGRVALDEYGDPLSAVMSGDASYGGEGLVLELTRQGARNPLLAKRANIVRIGYQFEEMIDKKEAEKWGIAHHKGNDQAGYFYRLDWPVIDKGSDTEPERQLLFSNVEEVSVSYLDKENNWIEEWPPVSGVKFSFSLGQETNASPDTPYAIKFKIKLLYQGVIERLYVLHAVPEI